MLDSILKDIAAPGVEMHGAPFFALNAKLDPEEMRREMNVFHTMGMGGCFLHTRVGLATPYLGKDYMDSLRAAVEECEKLGLKPWLYDEDRWPSGAAGGLVTKDPRFRMRKLVFLEAGEEMDTTVRDGGDAVYQAEANEGGEQTLAWFALKFDGEIMTSYRRINEADALEAGEKKFRAFRQTTPVGNPWFNGQTYLDTMNPDAVAEFIRVTHEAYKKEFGNYFGNVIPGIFTDEPTYSRSNFRAESSLPWTDRLPEAYEAKTGKSIIDEIPLLFYRLNGEPFAKVRVDFFDTAADLFHHSFMKQIGDWCEANNLAFTGHLLAEDTVISQIGTCGSAMRGYEYETAPGIDLLTEHWNIFDTAKQCTSVAHQFMKPYRLSETYGCTGWDFPFFGHKALGDWQYALGINFRCQHLSWYSMKGQAKRDYPACIFDQSPWYKSHHYLEDYFGRIGAALQHGEEQRSILVIHPIESTWGVFSCFNRTGEDDAVEVNRLCDVRMRLMKANLDFDYGEEEMMSRHARMDGDLLRMAKAAYKTVVVPQLRTIRKTTLDLLQDLHNHGGNVIYIGTPPEYLNGEKSSLPAEVFASFTQTELDDLAANVEAVDRIISIADRDGNEIEPVISLLKREGESMVLFICNTGCEFTTGFHADFVRNRKLVFPEAVISIANVPENAEVLEVDPLTGKITRVGFSLEEGMLFFNTSFDELQSRLFLIGQTSVEAEDPCMEQEISGTIALPENWKLVPDERNVLPLDMAKYSLDGGDFTGPEYILSLDGAVRQALGENPRGGHMVQPWLMEQMDQVERKSADLVLEYEFICDALPESDCFLGVEDAELFTIKLNGTELPAQDEGFWCDRSLRLRKVAKSLFRTGSNVLTLQIRYHAKLAGLETIYLLGNFSTADGKITGSAMPESAVTGNLGEKGLTYYSGNMGYETEIELTPEAGKRYLLEIKDWQGVGMLITCNGGEEIFLSWAPYKADLTPYLKDGKNTIRITLLGSRRNSHGPFYHPEVTPYWCGPGEFGYAQPNRNLVPFGLLSQPQIVVEG